MASRSPTLSQEARDSVPGTPEAGADSQPGPGVFCKLCLSEQPSAATSQLQSCNCNFCTACLQQYVQLAIMEGGGAPITCPDMACQKTGVLLDSEIASLAAADQVELYQRLKFERGVKLDPSRAWCPVVECQAVCSVQPGSEGQPSAVRCPTCHTVFCSGCRGPWQDSHTCPERQPMMSPSPSHESRGRSYSHSDMPIKQCPMCGIYIERNQGCAQMLCKSCKHTFCWYCLQNLDGDIFLRHYDKGPCRNKLGHSRASVMWNRTQVRPLRRPQSGPKLCPSSGATVTFIIPVGHLRQFDVQVQRGFRIRVTSLPCPDCCIVNYFEPLHLLKLGLPHT